MTRFHLLTVCAIGLTLLWVWLAPDSYFWVGAAGIAMAYFVLTGLGVAFPSWQMFGPFVCRGPADRKQVALTFDDGPDPQSTPLLLDLLKEASVPAAFFFVGEKAASHPEIVARAVREGHLIGNHSHRHSHGNNFFSTARLVDDIQSAQRAIEQAAGVVPAYYRPPAGLSNPRVFRAVNRLGLTAVGWTVRGLDKRAVSAERVVDRLVRGLKPGAILLLHDQGVPGDRLLETVRGLLSALKKPCYTVVRLDHMLGGEPARKP